MSARQKLDTEIRVLEHRVGVSAADVRAQVEDGTLRETLDVCRLLVLLELRERIRAG